jgi:hypothetical protein
MPSLIVTSPGRCPCCGIAPAAPGGIPGIPVAPPLIIFFNSSGCIARAMASS